MSTSETSPTPEGFHTGWYNPLDKFFRNDLMGLWNGNIPETIPAVNIRKRNDGLKIEIAVPGIKKENLEVQVKGNSLVISSENSLSSEEPGVFFRREYNYTSFSRSIPLPEFTNSDDITVKHIDGILCIFVPKHIDNQQTKNQKIKIG